MQNVVPPLIGGVAEQVASRAVAARLEASSGEVRRLVDAAVAVMRRTGSLDPRVGDIVRSAGLSNQAFYRHFRGKDELLLAVLDDGQRRLVGYLRARMARAEPGAPRVRAWIEGVLEQARNDEAAANTRPFAVNGARLADRFPEESARSRELVVEPLREAVADAGGDPGRDADAIYQLAFGVMNDALARRERPSRADVDHVVGFALAGIGKPAVAGPVVVGKERT
ncbi:MAG TPA: TetR/AcrR family transcriptional regulator [Acidimicrobiia bacterium]|nr:TetR/AcrR family transcriptional regulator [Acidimicrobiia bacterium]